MVFGPQAQVNWLTVVSQFEPEKGHMEMLNSTVMIITASVKLICGTQLVELHLPEVADFVLNK